MLRKLFTPVSMLFFIGVTKIMAAETSTIFPFQVQSIQGKALSLNDYRGKSLLIVNTASKCGYTPQYKELQALYEKYQSKGFVVLGFPSNDFGAQEPGKNDEIQKFCELNYGVTFPLFAKGPVKGADKQPLFRFLTEQGPRETQGEVKWNFTKFLVTSDGRLVKRFEPSVKPTAPEVTSAIEALLLSTAK